VAYVEHKLLCVFLFDLPVPTLTCAGHMNTTTLQPHSNTQEPGRHNMNPAGQEKANHGYYVSLLIIAQLMEKKNPECSINKA
jgi:hypothetical protein